MHKDSKSLILDHVKRKGRIGMDQLVSATDLGKTTIREHVVQLERDGYLQREYVRSGAGRPALHFSLTPEGHDQFPSVEHEMFRDLLAHLKERDDGELQAFFERFWKKRLNRIRKRLETLEQDGENTRDNRLQELTRFLEEEGFMPEVEIGDDSESFTVKECNCPYKSVIKETGIPCRLELLFYEELFGANVQRTGFIPDGDHACSYHIRPRHSDLV